MKNQQKNEFSHKFLLKNPKIYTNNTYKISTVTTDYTIAKELKNAGKDYLPLRRDLKIQKIQLNFGCDASENLNKPKPILQIEETNEKPIELIQEECLKKRKIEDLLSSDEELEGDHVIKIRNTVQQQVDKNSDLDDRRNNTQTDQLEYFDITNQMQKQHAFDQIKNFLRNRNATKTEIQNGALIQGKLHIRRDVIDEFLKQYGENIGKNKFQLLQK